VEETSESSRSAENHTLPSIGGDISSHTVKVERMEQETVFVDMDQAIKIEISDHDHIGNSENAFNIDGCELLNHERSAEDGRDFETNGISGSSYIHQKEASVPPESKNDQDLESGVPGRAFRRRWSKHREAAEVLDGPQEGSNATLLVPKVPDPELNVEDGATEKEQEAGRRNDAKDEHEAKKLEFNAHGLKKRKAHPYSYTCKECPYSSTRKANYVQHVRQHSGKWPYLCPHCQGTFVSKQSLTKHMRIHTGEKPYVCPHCDRRFTWEFGLKSHVLTHSTEKKYSCVKCGAKFRHKGNLNYHACRRPKSEAV